jgi:hypothetical protein
MEYFLRWQCTWGGESAKRPSTKQFVESLKKRIQILEAYVDRCRREHGDFADAMSDLNICETTSPITYHEDAELPGISEEEEDETEHLMRHNALVVSLFVAP